MTTLFSNNRLFTLGGFIIRNETQTKLIDIATPLFATRGYASVSVREITDAAQINISAISYHFNGKEGLYQAVLEEQCTPVWQALQIAQNNRALSPTERLTFYADQIARIHAQRPYLARFMSSETTNPTVHGRLVIEKHFSCLYHFLYTALQDGICIGEFQPDLNIAYAVVSLAGILNFYFVAKPLLQKFTSLTENANEEYTLHAFSIYMHGIKRNSEG